MADNSSNVCKQRRRQVWAREYLLLVQYDNGTSNLVPTRHLNTLGISMTDIKGELLPDIPDVMVFHPTEWTFMYVNM